MVAVDPYAKALADAADAALPRWVVRSVEARLVAWAGAADPQVLARAAEAGERARADVGGRLREVLAVDVDEQRTSPLAVLRSAVRFPTDVLRGAGVPPVPRDGFAVRAFPDDVYDLTPASWADVDPSLLEPGLVWGAWKAKVHLERRRAEGRVP